MTYFTFNATPTNPELESIRPHTVHKKTNYLRAYFNKIEKDLQDESTLLWKECQLENERTKDHEDDSEHDYRANDSLQEIEFIYLRMHRYSATLASYAYLESSMTKLCRELELWAPPTEAFANAKGDGIEKCRNYFKHITGEKFTTVNSAWCQIKTLNKIRNCIIHADGDSNRMKDKEKFIRLVQQNRELSFIEDNLVMISSDFIHRSINNIESLLIHMCEHKKTNTSK